MTKEQQIKMTEEMLKTLRDQLLSATDEATKTGIKNMIDMAVKKYRRIKKIIFKKFHKGCLHFSLYVL